MIRHKAQNNIEKNVLFPQSNMSHKCEVLRGTITNKGLDTRLLR